MAGNIHINTMKYLQNYSRRNCTLITKCKIAKKKQHPQDSARIQVPSDPKKKNLALKNKATNKQISMWKENKNSEKHTLSY